MSIHHRKPSLTMADLEESMCYSLGEYPFHSNSTLSVKEANEIVKFEGLCQDAEIEDVFTGRDENMMLRRSSIHGTSISYIDDSINKFSVINIRHKRRHSSYNPRNRKIHRDAHANLEEYLIQLEQHTNPKLAKRSDIVNTLLEFHASYEISLAASSQPDVSYGLQYSCPVLSYLHDSDEDSVEIQIVKKPSLHHECQVKGFNASSRSLHQCDEDDCSDSPVEDLEDNRWMESEYTFELPEMTELDQTSYLRKRRKSHSYQVLQRRLSSESHLSVLRGLMQKDGEEFYTHDGLLDPDNTSMLNPTIPSIESSNNSSLQRETDSIQSLKNTYARVA
jgi:hypothetical protein